MQKIASNGATVTNEFTEGNASLNIPATVVSADWLNSIQREMVNFLLLLTGAVPLTPLTDTFDQLVTAVKDFFLRGGRLAPIAHAIANNQTIASDVTQFPTFSKAVIRSLAFDFYVNRQTDTENVSTSGRGQAYYNPTTNVWKVVLNEAEVSGLQLLVAVDTGDLSGNTYKMQYKTDSLVGGSYVGELKISNLTQIRIS